MTVILEGTFAGSVHPREILRVSFLELLALADINYYEDSTLIADSNRVVLRNLINKSEVTLDVDALEETLNGSNKKSVVEN